MPARRGPRGLAVAMALMVVVCGTPFVTAIAMTRAQARALAQAISLTAADVPGFTARPVHPIFGKQTGSCAKLTARPRRDLAFIVSAFEQQTASSFFEVSSTLTVVRRAALATHQLTAFRKHARKCIRKGVKQALRASGVKVLRVFITALPAPTSSGVGLRIKLRLSESGHPITD